VIFELCRPEIKSGLPELLYVDEDEYLISVALNRRHLTEEQKAVLANNYSKFLSEKLPSEAGKIKANARWHPDEEYSSERVSEQHDEKVKNDARKIASKRLKVSEWKVRIAQEIGDIVKFPYRT